MLTPYISSWLRAPSIRDKLKSIYTHAQLARLILLNYFGRKAITLHGTPAIVSLTSYGGRMRFVHLVVESIGRGELRPQRLILWLDEASAPLANTPGLMRLAKRGLEIKLCRDYRSYKKFYPYVEANDAFTTSLVTADDDVLYPRGWLKNLVAASERMPNAIVCSRGRYIELQNSVVAPYQYWKLLRTTKPSRRNFATGVGGVLYPPLFQKVLKDAGTGFLTSCPRNDDIWLHVHALRSGTIVRQMSEKLFRIYEIPGSQEQALQSSNLYNGGNDQQIKTTYMASDICLMLQDES